MVPEYSDQERGMIVERKKNTQAVEYYQIIFKRSFQPERHVACSLSLEHKSNTPGLMIGAGVPVNDLHGFKVTAEYTSD